MATSPYKFLRPLIFLQDPEKAHDRILRLGRFAQRKGRTKFLEKSFRFHHPSLQTIFCGIHLKNPVGLAAGFDKNGIISESIESLGFGHEEVGSITARGWKGNPKPRLFRLPKDEAIINRMGLNGQPAEQVAENLRQRGSWLPIGINLAKTHSPDIMGEAAIQDFRDSYQATRKQGNYLVLNVSCPNTTEGKTFEDLGALKELLSAIQNDRSNSDKRPYGIKLSPDLKEKQLGKIFKVCEDHGIDFYIISNTSSQRQGLTTSGTELQQIGNGGLSGRPIRDKSTGLIRFAYNETRKPIIGVGGIFTAEDAYDKIKAGASAVQLLTGLVYEGPAVAKNINKGLVKLLEKGGFDNISQAVGIAT